MAKRGQIALGDNITETAESQGTKIFQQTGGRGGWWGWAGMKMRFNTQMTSQTVASDDLSEDLLFPKWSLCYCINHLFSATVPNYIWNADWKVRSLLNIIMVREGVEGVSEVQSIKIKLRKNLAWVYSSLRLFFILQVYFNCKNQTCAHWFLLSFRYALTKRTLLGKVAH